MKSIDEVKKMANLLMFDMEESEYETLLKESEIFEKQMELIGQVSGIENVEPMNFPFVTYQAKLRKDEVKNTLDTEEGLSNAKYVDKDQVKVPKVVE